MKRIASAVRSLAPAGLVPVLLLVASCTAVRNPSPCEVPWGYGPDDGPSRWAQLSTCYAECGRGEEQSPTDLTKAVFAADLPNLWFDYNRGATLAVVNNGHTIKAKVPPGSVFKLGETQFALDELHFHTLSEHRLNGFQTPLELHLVNKGSGGTAAVGIFIILDPDNRENPQLAKIWKGLEEYTKDPTPVADVDIMALLPSRYSSFRYPGSLTTPACGQGLQWSVLVTPITASQEQIDRFEKLFRPYGNSRGSQRLHSRTVQKDFH
jgi:carbonic anhydrase